MKKPKNNYLSMGFGIKKLPPGMSLNDALHAALRAAESGTGKLPEGLEIQWRWKNRNQETQAGKSHHPQDDKGRYYSDFETVVAESRSSFLHLMGKRLRREINRLQFEEPQEYTPREATPREVEQIEEEEEENLTQRRERNYGQKKRKRGQQKSALLKMIKKASRQREKTLTQAQKKTKKNIGKTQKATRKSLKKAIDEGVQSGLLVSQKGKRTAARPRQPRKKNKKR